MLSRPRSQGLVSAGLALALLVIASATAAQDRASIIGRVVVGRSGAPNVRLELMLTTSIGLEVTRGYTDEEGKFRFIGLSAGDYKVIVKAPPNGHYKDAVVDVHIDVRIGSQSSSLTVVLEAADPDRAPASAGTVAVGETQSSIPREAKKLYERGTRAAAAGHAEEAAAFFRHALEIAPDYLFALNDLGSQLIKLDKLDESIAVLRKATAIAPRAYSPRMNLSLALLFARKPAEAQAEIAIALEARPDEPGALYVSGEIEHALGNRQAAIAAFEGALLHSSGRLVAALIQLGKLHEEAGDGAAAVQAYRTYLDAAADGPSAAFARSRIEALRAPAKPAP